MKLKYSLLQKNNDNNAVCEIIYDLSIDRAVHRLVNDERRADYFLSVLEKPLTDIENIQYRQQIYEDFSENEGLLSALKTLLSRYDRIKSDWQEMKLGDAASRGGDINAEVLLEHTFASLKVTAIFPSTIASFFESIGELLQKYPIRSEGLTAIRNKCVEMQNNEAISELVKISQLFRYQSPEYFDFTVTAKTDNALRLISCDLTDIDEHNEHKGFRLFGSKKSDGFTEIKNNLSDSGEDAYSDGVRMLCDALRRIDVALTEITGRVYDAFFGLSTELMFYESAISIMKTASESGVPFVMPTLLDDTADRISVTGLRELMLLANGEGRSTVPNDIELEHCKAGLIVKGLTDSGKTVYLRAIGGAQLFAQAGLPVLAEKAELSIRHGFFSHFSSAEEEFLKGDVSGRFDQEAKEISKIVDALRPYSLLLLNETFQTTSYREGTESIGRILRYMPRLETKYIFVTHLTGLFTYMENEDVIFARTSENEAEKYRIIIGK